MVLTRFLQRSSQVFAIFLGWKHIKLSFPNTHYFAHSICESMTFGTQPQAVKRNLVRSPSQAAHSFCLRRVGLLWSSCGQCTKTILGLVVYLLRNSTPQCENDIKWTITGTNQQKPWRNEAKQWKSSYCGSDRQKEGIFYKHESIHFFN